jgi:hypothetical protein
MCKFNSSECVKRENISTANSLFISHRVQHDPMVQNEEFAALISGTKSFSVCAQQALSEYTKKGKMLMNLDRKFAEADRMD